MALNGQVDAFMRHPIFKVAVALMAGLYLAYFAMIFGGIKDSLASAKLEQNETRDSLKETQKALTEYIRMKADSDARVAEQLANMTDQMFELRLTFTKDVDREVLCRAREKAYKQKGGN